MTCGFLLVGCQSPDFAQGVASAVHQSGVGDARLRLVRQLPTVRVTSYLAEELREAGLEGDVEAMRRRALAALEEAHRLGLEASAHEVDRLPDSVLAGLWSTYFQQSPRPPSLRNAIKTKLNVAGQLKYQAWADRITSAGTAAELAPLLRELCRRIEPPVSRQGRDLRAALNWPVAFSVPPARVAADAEAGGQRAAPSLVYEPDVLSAAEFVSDAAGPSFDAELLLSLAPAVVQECLRRPPYDENTDDIGRVRFSGSPVSPRIDIDAAAPTFYGYWQPTEIHGRPRLQLVYVFWYPRRSAIGRAMACVGPIDGLTLRITLDDRYRPGVFETMCCCGHDYRVWVADFVEEAARREFGPPAAGRTFAVEQSRWPDADYAVQGVLEVPPKPDAGPILLITAGTHEIRALTYDRSILFEEEVGGYRRYVLRPYEVLERAAIEGRATSMFGPDGLVYGAVRKDGWLLAHTGVLGPGRPRQRGTHLIHGGRDDFGDPHLLEKCLRLPAGF